MSKKEKPSTLTLGERLKQAEEDFKGVKEQEYNEGDREQGTIIDVEDGMLKDFILSEKAIKAWKGDLMEPCINITINLDNSALSFTKTMTFKMGSTNSKLYRYRKKYNKFPEVNDKILLEFDGKYWKMAGID